jgi:hypothetical protein
MMKIFEALKKADIDQTMSLPEIRRSLDHQLSRAVQVSRRSQTCNVCKEELA